MTAPTLPPPDEAPLPFDLRTIGIAMRARGRALAVVLLAAVAIGVTGGLTVGKREYAADTVLLHRPIRAGGQETGTADCRAEIHVCRMCRFYDTTKARQCVEPVAEPVQDKERANFCGYFEPVTGRFKPADPAADSARAALDALFGPRK